MIRRFNYTQRKKIVASRVPVTIAPGEDGFYTFDTQVNLRGLNLPKEAKVFIEAYHQFSFMRFPLGEAGDIVLPADRGLRDIDRGALPMFRLKVVDVAGQYGKLLALADKIVPRHAAEETVGQVDLLPVEFYDIGDEVWQLNLTGDRPVLVLNKKIPHIGEISSADPLFISLVFPEVVRKILNRIVVEDDNTDPRHDETDWSSQWLKFVLKLPGVVHPPSGGGPLVREEKKDWIEAVIRAFCNRWRTREEFIRGSSARNILWSSP